MEKCRPFRGLCNSSRSCSPTPRLCPPVLVPAGLPFRFAFLGSPPRSVVLPMRRSPPPGPSFRLRLPCAAQPAPSRYSVPAPSPAPVRPLSLHVALPMHQTSGLHPAPLRHPRSPYGAPSIALTASFTPLAALRSGSVARPYTALASPSFCIVPFLPCWIPLPSAIGPMSIPRCRSNTGSRRSYSVPRPLLLIVPIPIPSLPVQFRFALVLFLSNVSPLTSFRSILSLVSPIRYPPLRRRSIAGGAPCTYPRSTAPLSNRSNTGFHAADPVSSPSVLPALALSSSASLCHARSCPPS